MLEADFVISFFIDPSTVADCIAQPGKVLMVEVFGDHGQYRKCTVADRPKVPQDVPRIRYAGPEGWK